MEHVWVWINCWYDCFAIHDKLNSWLLFGEETDFYSIKSIRINVNDGRLVILLPPIILWESIGKLFIPVHQISTTKFPTLPNPFPDNILWTQHLINSLLLFVSLLNILIDFFIELNNNFCKLFIIDIFFWQNLIKLILKGFQWSLNLFWNPWEPLLIILGLLFA